MIHKLKDTETISKQELKNILLSMFVISGANNDQGLKVIAGENYEEKIDNILNNYQLQESAISNIQLIPTNH